MTPCRLVVLVSLAAVLATTLAQAEEAARPPKSETGEASFYGEQSAGETTASGAPFDPTKLTAASPTLPFGTKAKVTNQATGQSVNVTITDRGPFAKDRIIDVSPKAAEHLGMKEDGVAQVKIQPLSVPKKAP